MPDTELAPVTRQRGARVRRSRTARDAEKRRAAHMRKWTMARRRRDRFTDEELESEERALAAEIARMVAAGQVTKVKTGVSGLDD